VRILFISDIHANQEALEACLAAAPAHDRVVNLGDIVGYGANPNEATEQSRRLGNMFVRGNHDKACTGLVGLDEFNPVAALAATWTRQTLTPENLEWLRAMPQGPLPLDGVEGAECVHGSPLDEDEYLIVIRDAYEPLMRTPASLTFFGHTHIQGGFSVVTAEDRWETIRPLYRFKSQAEWFDFPLQKTTKYLINPGSVGQPRDGDARAAFALFDVEAYKVAFHRVPYDLKQTQEKIYAAKLPERLATRLAEGR